MNKTTRLKRLLGAKKPLIALGTYEVLSAGPFARRYPVPASLFASTPAARIER